MEREEYTVHPIGQDEAGKLLAEIYEIERQQARLNQQAMNFVAYLKFRAEETGNAAFLAVAWHISSQVACAVEDDHLDDARLATEAPDIHDALAMAPDGVRIVEDDEPYHGQCAKCGCQIVQRRLELIEVSDTAFVWNCPICHGASNV